MLLGLELSEPRRADSELVECLDRLAGPLGGLGNAPRHSLHTHCEGIERDAREVAGISSPKLGLLNIGTEETKGNLLIAKTHQRLADSHLPFVGNVEANSVLSTRPVDVVVCDGFVGNVFLKSVEGGVYAVAQLLKRTIRGRVIAMLGALLMSGSIARVRGTLSYRRRGGAVLLGVKGVVVIAHGRSDAVAIENAIDVAAKQVEADLSSRFAEGLSGWDAHA